MSWKTEWRSFYYADAPEAEPPPLEGDATAFLVVDIQNKYMQVAGNSCEWEPFQERMHGTVIPNTARVLGEMRRRGLPCLFARIACRMPDGRDRSLSQKLPGWNNLLLPAWEHESQIVPELAPRPDEIVVTKTTDSALTGTSLRLMLANMGIRTVIVAGIFTDQCISSTVRSLADESFHVVLLEDCCAAGTLELHEAELRILNRIYCTVMRTGDLMDLLRET